MKAHDVLIGDITLYSDVDKVGDIIHTLFIEDDENYYDLLNDNRSYFKDAATGYDPKVDIKYRLDDIINIDKNYELSIEDILLILPKEISDNITFNPLKDDVKQKRLVYNISRIMDD